MSENNRTEPEMGVYVRIEDVMMLPQEDLVETFAKAAAKEQDEAIAGEICQVLARYGIEITPEVLLDKVQELDDRSNKRYRSGYIDGYRKALEVRHGRWIKVRGSWVTPGGDPVWECSECGKGRHCFGIEHGTYGVDIADGQWVSCPNCGAKMDGGADDAVD